MLCLLNVNGSSVEVVVESSACGGEWRKDCKNTLLKALGCICSKRIMSNWVTLSRSFMMHYKLLWVITSCCIVSGLIGLGLFFTVTASLLWYLSVLVTLLFTHNLISKCPAIYDSSNPNHWDHDVIVASRKETYCIVVNRSNLWSYESSGCWVVTCLKLMQSVLTRVCQN